MISNQPASQSLTFSGHSYSNDQKCLIGPDGESIRLRAKSLAVFCYLADHADKVVSKEAVVSAVWPGLFVTDDSLTQCISDIRRAISDRKRSTLRTIPRQGYTLVSDARPLDTDQDQSGITPPSSTISQPERRQMTAMFCDLCGSAEFSARLDPEALHEVYATYRHSVAQVVQTYAGHLAQDSGDRLLIYFGYPVAHEDDPQRAVYAGINIQKELRQLNTAVQAQFKIMLSCRISIHTGIVVIGRMGTDSPMDLAVGDTIHQASRQLELADTEGIVVSEATRPLLGGMFRLSPRGQRTRNTQREGLAAFSVDGVRLTETRFGAAKAEQLSPMVGRRRELARLENLWQLTKAGRGQAVVLSGEAGIGKSRLLADFEHAVAQEDLQKITCQCSPHHTDSSLYPLIRYLNIAYRTAPGESFESTLNKLEQWLRPCHSEPETAIRIIGNLLGLSDAATARYGEMPATPRQRREMTLKILNERLVCDDAERPVLFVLEDAHWADPTTLELVQLALSQIGSHRVMLLIIARPEFPALADSERIVERMSLTRLNRSQCIGMVEHIASSDPLPHSIIENIVDRTDGVPLFIEEITKSLLEQRINATKETGDGSALTEPSPIPLSLHDSLMARLDRMQPIKAVAQIAACIGREFEFSLLASVTELSPTQLKGALDRLVSSELLFESRTASTYGYIFKHALICDAAYQSLLKSKRQKIHTKLLEQMELSGDAADEVLAHHAEQAGQIATAIDYWEKAGDRSFDRPAFDEAASHYKRAQGCLKRFEDTLSNRLRDLDLRVKLNHVAMAHYGFAHEQTAATAQAAAAMLDQVGETPRRFPVLYTNWVTRNATAKHHCALRDAQAMCLEAQRNSDRVQELISHRVYGTSHLMLGHFDKSILAFEQARARYEPNKDARLAWQYGHDPADAIDLYGGMALACKGELEQVWQQTAQAHDRARKRGHMSSYCYVLAYVALIQAVVRSPEALRWTDELARTAEEFELVFYLGYGAGAAGLALHAKQQHTESIKKLDYALDKIEESGAEICKVHFKASRASSLAALGRLDEAQNAAFAAISLLEHSSEQWAAAEVYRLAGDVHYQTRRATDEAVRYLERALEVAKSQNAWLWHLRASVSLARLLRDQGDIAHALQRLKAGMRKFPAGGRYAVDMIEARTLARQLYTHSLLRSSPNI